jgi:hypothetical protein
MPYNASTKDFALLKAADPGGDLAVIVARLNDPNDSLGTDNLEPVGKDVVNKWGAQTGGVLAIKSVSEDNAHARQAICHAAISNFSNPNIFTLDLTDPDIMGMLLALTVESSAGLNDAVITEAVKDSLISAATARRSWAEMNWTRQVHIGDLQIARLP